MDGPRVDRRLAAVLAADLVGYSRLMERDELGTLRKVKSIQTTLLPPLLSEHRGRLVKLIDDGFLCEFASVIDAVRFAIAFHEVVSAGGDECPADDRILYRIGINIGDVIVEGDDIHGDGVNVAARLEQLAAPGSICVSDSVREHMSGKIAAAMVDLGLQRLKNLDRPVRAFKIVPAGRPAGRASRARWMFAAAAVVFVGLIVVAILALTHWRRTNEDYLEAGKRAYLLGHLQEAINAYRQAGELTADAQAFLAASYAASGMGKEARALAQDILRANPRFSVHDFIRRRSGALDDVKRSALENSLVALGLPLDLRWECLVRNVCP